MPVSNGASTPPTLVGGRTGPSADSAGRYAFYAGDVFTKIQVAEGPPPPLPRPVPWWQRVWGEIWRVGLALVMGMMFFAFRLIDAEEASPTGPEDVLIGSGHPIAVLLVADFVLGLIAVVLVLFRRRWPLPVAVVTAASTALSMGAAPASLLCLASLATRRRRSDLYVIAPLFVAAALLAEWIWPTADMPWRFAVAAGVTLLVFTATWYIGAYTGTRRELVTTLHERAVAQESEQAARIDAARSGERARIAQEMHDVLAHRISLIAVHANVLAYRDDLTRDQVAEHAGIVRDNADRAVSELAGVLGVLRGGAGADNAAPPQPTLDGLTDLLQDATRSGTPVAIVGAMPDLDDLPVKTSRTAYRIVQECLTNARKHATGLPVTVSIGGEEGVALDIAVSNPLAAPAGPGAAGAAGGPSDGPSAAAEPAIGGTGMGLIGLAERAALAGGSLEHGLSDGFYVVRARLPWGTP